MMRATPATLTRIVATIAMALGLQVSTGCMTLDHLLDMKQPLEMYGGTSSSYAYVDNPSSPFVGTLIRVIDLPATLVGDTLLLPISATVEATR